MFKFCAFPQSQGVGWLSACVQKQHKGFLRVTCVVAFGGTHKELAMELGSWEMHSMLKVPEDQSEGLQVRCPHWLMDRLPDGACRVISRIILCLLGVLAALLVPPCLTVV